MLEAKTAALRKDNDNLKTALASEQSSSTSLSNTVQQLREEIQLLLQHKNQQELSPRKTAPRELVTDGDDYLNLYNDLHFKGEEAGTRAVCLSIENNLNFKF